MWEPRRLTTLWAFTACYRDNFFKKITGAHNKQIVVEQAEKDRLDSLVCPLLINRVVMVN
jgi:hypothetical protein